MFILCSVYSYCARVSSGLQKNITLFDQSSQSALDKHMSQNLCITIIPPPCTWKSASTVAKSPHVLHR